MLRDLLNQHAVELILASQSPRRSQLMSDAEIPFQLADNYSVEEKFPDTLAPRDVPIFLAELKSMAYPNALRTNQIVVTADTVVILGTEVLGKPAGRDQAIAMLCSLSGQMHEVVTGITLRDSQRTRSFSVLSRVFFRVLTIAEIEHYVDTYSPFDKAGGYGIQEWIGYVGIEKIEGSFYNVMGLPIQALYQELIEFITKTR